MKIKTKILVLFLGLMMIGISNPVLAGRYQSERRWESYQRREIRPTRRTSVRNYYDQRTYVENNIDVDVRNYPPTYSHTTPYVNPYPSGYYTYRGYYGYSGPSGYDYYGSGYIGHPMSSQQYYPYYLDYQGQFGYRCTAVVVYG